LHRTRKKPRRSGAFCLAAGLPEKRLALALLRLAALTGLVVALLATLTRLLLLLTRTRIAALLLTRFLVLVLLVRIVLVLVGHLSLLE
jgi:hypothetical protein